MLGGKYYVCVRGVRLQINVLSFHLKTLEKEEKIKPKVSRRNELVLKAKIVKYKVREIKSWLFETSKIDKPPV